MDQSSCQHMPTCHAPMCQHHTGLNQRPLHMLPAAVSSSFSSRHTCLCSKPEHHYSTLCALNAWKSGMSMEKAHAPWLKATQYKCGQGPANMTAHTPVPLCLRLTRPQGRTTSFSAEELPWGPKGLAPPRHMLSILDQLRGPVPLNPARRPAVKAKNIGESKSHLGNS